MTGTLGALKIAKPRLPVALARPRLFAHLDDAAARTALWIAGPPGAGKTVLAGSYLAERKLPHIWYQIGAEDADLATFFHYFALAAPRRRTPLPHLTPEYLAGLSLFARNYFEQLYARLKPPFAIVLDNYQELSEDAPLQGVIEAALAMAPAGIQFIVLSRQSPPAALVRLRVHGILQELDARLLAFTGEETRLWVAERRSPSAPAVSAQEVHDLHERTGGWAAGLVLLLERGVGSDSPADTRAEMSHDVLFEYFAAEIFERMPAAARDILLRTAFLPRIDPQSAAALTGDTAAVDLFREYSRRHYFTVRHSDGSYQLHPLFRAFLLRRAAQAFDRETLRAYQLAAARAAETAVPEEAVGLYLQASAWDEAARLVCALAPGLGEQGRHQILAQWIETLPPASVADSAWLQYWLGTSVLWGIRSGRRPIWNRPTHNFGLGRMPRAPFWPGRASSRQSCTPGARSPAWIAGSPRWSRCCGSSRNFLRP